MMKINIEFAHDERLRPPKKYLTFRSLTEMAVISPPCVINKQIEGGVRALYRLIISAPLSHPPPSQAYFLETPSLLDIWIEVKRLNCLFNVVAVDFSLILSFSGAECHLTRKMSVCV